MPKMNAATSTLVMVDFQQRLMPAIHDGAGAIANARRLVDAAGLLDVPVVFTEQNPAGLGSTVLELAVAGAAVVPKKTFDAVDDSGFLAALADNHALVVAGCEAHVCVLQTVLGLLSEQRKVFVVRDAVGSRQPDNKAAAIERMAANGAEIVTTEMVVFEWLQTASHPRFREAVALIR
jgi:nicotinamidase-related amidase